MGLYRDVQENHCKENYIVEDPKGVFTCICVCVYYLNPLDGHLISVTLFQFQDFHLEFYLTKPNTAGPVSLKPN